MNLEITSWTSLSPLKLQSPWFVILLWTLLLKLQAALESLAGGLGWPNLFSQFANSNWKSIITWTSWWFQIFVIFIPTWGKIPILTNIFQMGWNHQLVNPWDNFPPVDLFFSSSLETLRDPIRSPCQWLGCRFSLWNAYKFHATIVSFGEWIFHETCAQGQLLVRGGNSNTFFHFHPGNLGKIRWTHFAESIVFNWVGSTTTYLEDHPS